MEEGAGLFSREIGGVNRFGRTDWCCQIVEVWLWVCVCVCVWVGELHVCDTQFTKYMSTQYTHEVLSRFPNNHVITLYIRGLPSLACSNCCFSLSFSFRSAFSSASARCTRLHTHTHTHTHTKIILSTEIQEQPWKY